MFNFKLMNNFMEIRKPDLMGIGLIEFKELISKNNVVLTVRGTPRYEVVRRSRKWKSGMPQISFGRDLAQWATYRIDDELKICGVVKITTNSHHQEVCFIKKYKG